MCQVTAGGTPSRTNPAYFDGGIPWVKIGDMLQGRITSTEETISRKGLENSAAKLLPKGTVLISIFATVGRTAVLDLEAATNQAIAGVTPRNPNLLESNYLRYFLNNIANALERRARGVAQLNINSTILKALLIPLPPLSEQKRIAKILDRAEELRSKRRQAIAQLDTLTQAIFIEMFGDPITNHKNVKTVPLATVCKRITDGTHQPPKWSTSGHPFLFVSNIVTGEITFDTAKFISSETHKELTRRCPIEVGDVLYSTVGSYGVPAIVKTQRKFAFQRHIAHIKPDSNFIDSQFLCAMLASPPLKQQADRTARGVAQKTINLEEIRKFTIFCPPINIQQEFAQRIEAVEKLKAVHRTSLSELDALFASLQHRAFRGEL
ncbi:restriction endonuclease subunit S [Aphanothece hegewaldii CCALA 016]|uniref:Restriction endonuclease subunit S n=1 Tax=Aphanothece hegewaldii CCALA 016 TaxID=2107694 RepID=A0A2T1LQR9_9CHRO|nr:restriction endonuclease subunit S [Aphanothece hegewaldii]PSF29449.1 restriction endonuclease subunit S [Aphanothece hegewaldii CCALA 016]